MPPGVTNFPASLDDAISLIEANNQASSTLTAGITATSLLIPVADPAEFPNSGLATLTDSITPWTSAPTKIEIFRYTSKSGSNLVVPSTADRGIYGTTAQSWNSGQFVGQRFTARHHTVLADAQIATQAKLGFRASTPAINAVLVSPANGESEWAQIVNANISNSAAIALSKLADGSGLSVVGRSANSAGAHADIAAANDGEVLRRNGTALGFGTIATAGIGDGQVTYAKLQDVSATQRVIGRNTAGSGDAEEVTASQLLDWLGNTRGSVLVRGAAGWAILAPGTSGHVLTSNGASADPSYQAPSGGGGGGANTALSNLASVAINASLISDTDDTDDLGSSGIRWRNLFLSGFARLGGTATDTFTTPGAAAVPTKVNIPLFNPGAFGQILAFGMNSSAANTARVLSLFDQRGSGHQPTLQVFNPNEDALFGLTWDGSNATAQVMTDQNLRLTAIRIFQKAPATAPADGDIPNSYISAWLNEGANQLTFRVRYSDGTLKTATLALT
jgi:hypothetical protein